MNDSEQFLFDLNGYLKVPDFLTPGEVRDLNAALDANRDQRLEDPTHHTGDGDALQGKRRSIFSGMLEWQQPHSLPFRALLAHRKLIPYLDTLFGRGWKMDHSPVLSCGGKGSEGLLLHGSTARLFNGSQYYTYSNGQMRCGMIVCSFQLADVNEGDGGFCCIPGSHKANFPLPEPIRNWEEHREVVYNVPCKAGDMIIFNEATVHGTLPWQGEQERRALLYRYSPKYLHFAGGTYRTSQPEWVSELTEAQQAVLEPPYIYDRPLIDEDGETVTRPHAG